MRVSLVCASAFAAFAAVLGVLACSSTGGQAAGNPNVPEGGTQLDDGAVVGPDGEVVDPPDTAKPSKVEATNETVTVLGQTRQYVLVVPKTYDAARKYPLIIALHGDGQDGPSFRAFLTFDDVAGDDAIVAYPTGAEDLYTAYDQNPDQQVVQATIDAVKGKRSIDDTKIWGFGYSKGGFMLNQVSCLKPGTFTALAIHAGGAPDTTKGTDGYPQCPGLQGLPVLETEGELDTAIGGEYGANFWAKTAGCAAGRSATTPAPCEKYDGCPAGKPVVYCLAPGVRHYPIWAKAVDASWAFFKTL